MDKNEPPGDDIVDLASYKASLEAQTDARLSPVAKEWQAAEQAWEESEALWGKVDKKYTAQAEAWKEARQKWRGVYELWKNMGEERHEESLQGARESLESAKMAKKEADRMRHINRRRASLALQIACCLGISVSCVHKLVQMVWLEPGKKLEHALVYAREAQNTISTAKHKTEEAANSIHIASERYLKASQAWEETAESWVDNQEVVFAAQRASNALLRATVYFQLEEMKWHRKSIELDAWLAQLDAIVEKHGP